MCFLSVLNWLPLMPMNLDIHFNSRFCSTLGMFGNCFCKLLVIGKKMFSSGWALLWLSIASKYIPQWDKCVCCLDLVCQIFMWNISSREGRMTCTVQVLHGRLTPTVWNPISVYFLKWKLRACLWVLGLDQTSLPVRPGRNDWISSRFGSC